MRIPEDIDWVMELLAEAKRTERNIQYRMSDGSWSNCGKPSFDYARDDYRVQPAPPQPKFRPMNDGELIQLARRGVIVEADYGDTVCIGTLQYIFAGNRALFTVCGRTIDPEKIRYADTREPIQVEE